MKNKRHNVVYTDVVEHKRMNPLKFEISKKDEIFEYRFYPKGGELIICNDEHFSNNDRLWENWCNCEGLPASYEKFNLSNSATGENILLYMLLIFELANNKNILGVGSWETDEIEKCINQKPNLINWEYKLEHEYIIKGDYIRRDLGFVKAKSPTIYKYKKRINRTPTNRTGLFSLKTFNHLVDFLKPGFSDATSLTNYYIVSEDISLIKKLKSKKKPKFDFLLQEQDIFISLLIGEDVGYFDYLLIKSKSDLTNKLQAISTKINAFAKDYIESIKEIETPEKMIELIENKIKKYALQQIYKKNKGKLQN